MNRLFLLVNILIASLPLQAQPSKKQLQPTPPVELVKLLEVSAGSPIGQLQAVPVQLGKTGPRAILAVYGKDSEVNPSEKMFFYPTDNLHLMLFTDKGEILWKKDMGSGVLPGNSFCPVFSFDLDEDSVDEIYFVDNADPVHPFNWSQYKLARLDARTRKPAGQWPWPRVEEQKLSHTYRNFIFGGYDHGKPILITAQGTYGPMALQAWNPDMSRKWEYKIKRDTPGARGSYMTPVIDLNHDGTDEILWGERVIDVATGKQLHCADEQLWAEHSDVILPILNRKTNRHYIYTCREKDEPNDPRIALYDEQGKRIWGDVDRGHMDIGWVAHLKDQKPIAISIRIGGKTAGPDGFKRSGLEEFSWRALTGEKLKLPYSVYQAFPVDLNGDGYHELVRSRTDAEVQEEGIIPVDGKIAMLSQFMNHEGEQLLCFTPDGRISVWADKNAKDTPLAKKRYAHPYYSLNQRFTASGYNLVLLSVL